MLVHVVDERVGIGGEERRGMFVVLGSAEVDLARAVFFVADFDTGTAQVLFADDDGVAGGVAPVVVVEGACAIGEVAEYEADVVGDVPAELDTVEIELGVLAAVAHGGRVRVEVAPGFGGLVVAQGVLVARVGVRFDGHRNVLVHVRLGGKVDVLVCGVDGAEMLVEIATVVKVDGSVQFDINGEREACGHEGDGQNEFAHKILLKKFLGKR